jgi:hypothetical protein
VAAPGVLLNRTCLGKIHHYTPAVKEHVVKRLALTFLVVSMLVACSNPPTPEPAQSPLSPVATPQATAQAAPLAALMPTSQAGYGTVTGRLVSQGTDRPLDNKTVYLGAITDASDTNFSVAALDKFSPMFTTDGQGNFIFIDVPPGRYGLILESVLDTVLLADLSTGKEIVIVVAADQTIDLGKIEILPNH